MRNLLVALVITVAVISRAPAADQPASPAIDAFPRTLPGRLSFYMPNYIIYGPGGNEPAVKFQLSLQYRLMTLGTPPADGTRPTLKLAYTQRSLWDVSAPSEPFYDTSYMPEVFVESLKPASDFHRLRAFNGWAAGYRHESNGKDGDDSRGYDIVYARGHFSFGSPSSWYLAAIPEVWQYFASTHDQMPDVAKYRGYGKLYLIAGRGLGPSLIWTMIPEHGFSHVTHQADFFVPLAIHKLDFATYFVAQYFDGYAESLRNYTHYSRSIRVGLSLVR